MVLPSQDLTTMVLTPPPEFYVAVVYVACEKDLAMAQSKNLEYFTVDQGN